MMLGSGVAPVGEMRVAKLQKVWHRDPSALSAEAALDMATIGGARALHMESEIGSLEPGKKADLIVLALDSPNGVPLYDIYMRRSSTP
jgi:5-methylthioadenosine/S-adenosylhomocysteine deaminase